MRTGDLLSQLGYFSMSHIPFCIARVGEPINDLEQCDVHFVANELPNAEAVIEFLQNTRERFATHIADSNAELPDDERIDLSSIEGFGVQLTNRFGGVIEFGLGRRFSLLIRLAPKPTKIYRKPTDKQGSLVFFIDGWHHTEMEISDLISRHESLIALRYWLESNMLPDSQ